MERENVDEISGLSARLIEPRRFPTRRWFASTPLWYYHSPRGRDLPRIRADERFYAHVDPCLREVCRALHGAGLMTTPSCQGHDYPRAFFEEVWSDLVREHHLIRGPGLPVLESETQQRFVFRDPAYRLPWACFRAFHAEAAAGQSRGYLGILVPARSGTLVSRLERGAFRCGPARLRRETRQASPGAVLFSLTVDPAPRALREDAWARAAERLSGMVAERAAR